MKIQNLFFNSMKYGMLKGLLRIRCWKISSFCRTTIRIPAQLHFILLMIGGQVTIYFLPTVSIAQNTWAKKADYAGGNRWSAFGLSIGNKGYIGTGSSGGGTHLKDFWEYDPATDTWTQRADFGGGGRRYAVAFSIGNKGYAGTGDLDNTTIMKDFWEYDPAINLWTKKADFGGPTRFMATGFAINGKGYIGTGMDATFSAHYKDFWEYDPITDVWTKKTDFGGGARRAAVAFAVGSKGYIGTGLGAGYFKDFWEYDPATDTWTKKLDFPGSPIRDWAAAFGDLCGKGYVATGDNNTGVPQKDLWEYDPVGSTWTQRADFGSGTGKLEAVAFTIGTKGYLGVGGSNFFPEKDFWEYTPVSCSVLNVNITSANPLCNGVCTGTAVVTPSSGTIPYTYVWNNGQSTSAITGLCIGTYSVLVSDASSTTTTATVTITQPSPLSINTSFTPAACSSASGTATANAGGGIPGYTYSWNTGPVQTTATATGLAAGAYTVAITDANGCSATQTVVVASSGSINTNQSSSICSGSTYTLPGGTVVNTGGIYNDTLLSAGGCDSIITTTLTMDSMFTTNQSAGICSGSNYTLPGGTVVNTSGIYIDTLTSVGGCDSIITTTLTIDSMFTTNQSASICSGSNYTLPGGTVVNTSGMYIDTLTAVTGCDSIIATMLTVNSLLITNLSASICSGSSYTLPGGTIVGVGGIYNDTLTSVNACDSIITTTLTVNSNPTAAVFSIPAMSGQVVTITQGQSITLTASGGGTYNWSNGTNDSSIIVTPPSTAIYCVTVTDTSNCTDTACVTVVIEPIDCSNAGAFYVPNAFSPNGDGENDVLKIYYGNMLCIKTFALVIYDRWGEKIFTTINPLTEWDGLYKGRMMNAAVFVYYLNATLISGEEITRKGNMSLLR